VDILIFFKNKIFLSIFWLDIWWDVARHSNTPGLSTLVGFVDVDWQR